MDRGRPTRLSSKSGCGGRGRRAGGEQAGLMLGRGTGVRCPPQSCSLSPPPGLVELWAEQRMRTETFRLAEPLGGCLIKSSLGLYSWFLIGDVQILTISPLTQMSLISTPFTLRGRPRMGAGHTDQPCDYRAGSPSQMSARHPGREGELEMDFS